ncbi:MAG: class II fructose-bisphosphate aldolase family protein [Bifidobacteriaceae bacterium]|jgi:fructose-bisphosphate aldolase class II|nr:class II fructose-bisphosphate aldolase family protein [Bifidobacteriaceae bacterium]
MPLVPSAEIIRPAAATAGGVGAFNVIQLELAEAIVAGGEDAGRPVILQISQNCVKYHGRLAPIARACQALARDAATPVAVHLDHAESFELIGEALDLGFDSIMYDGSKLPDQANRAATAAVAALAHARGAWVEAELGEIGGKDGVHAPGVRTDPEDAAQFVRDTGVDSLAVAVGSSHAMTSRDAKLDFELIAAIHAAVPVPLVLHGSSGVPDGDLAAAVKAGMTKINIATLLSQRFTGAVRATLDDNPTLVDTRKYFAPAREAVRAAVGGLLEVIA